jgi:hypothetical protein
MPPHLACLAPGFRSSTFARISRQYKFIIDSFVFLCMLLATGCGTMNAPNGRSASLQTGVEFRSKGPIPIPHKKLTVTISPRSTTVPSAGTQQFTAFLGNTSNTSVTWSAGTGTISNTGLFTAPRVSVASVTTVTASSTANPTKEAIAWVTVVPKGLAPPPPSSPLSAVPPPPTGDDNRYCDPGNVPRFEALDSPATLPQTCYYTAIAATPSPGTIRAVSDATSFSDALAAAACGDIIEIEAGSELSGHFTFPAKSCDANHYITVRTSGYASLPAEGVRVTPCYAAVASLPGRPDFNCVSLANVMAKIASPDALAAITFAAGANHYRLIGLEIAHGTNNPSYNGGLIRSLNGMDHIIFDRIYCHGHGSYDETGRCLNLGTGNYMAVIDSFISDFHCISNSTSGCGDSQGITLGGTETGFPENTWKIVNNFIEASTENMMAGGGGRGPGCCVVPSDVEIRRNHLFKPWVIWDPLDCHTGICLPNPNYIGIKFSTKNSFELKTGKRFLIEGNVWDTAWGGAALFFLSPKDQGGGSFGLCPLCLVQDITARYNIFEHAALGATIAGTTSDPPVSACTGPLVRVSMHDNLFDDVNKATWGHGTDGGWMFYVDTGHTCPPLQNISLRHNTGFPNNQAFMRVDEGNAGPPQETMPGFVFQDNIVPNAVYGVNGALGQYKTVLDAAFGVNAYIFDHNVIQGGGSHPYPAGNFFPVDWATVGFVNYDNGNGGDYHLSGQSPYKGAGSDGKDPGADMDLVMSYTSGVAIVQ